MTFFFNLAIQKKNAQKYFKPVLNWITVRYAPASNLSFNFLNHISLSLCMVSYMASSSVVTQLSSPKMAAENRTCVAHYRLYESVLVCELP